MASQYWLDRVAGMAGGTHGLLKYKKARVSAATSETESGIVLPDNAVVYDCFINVVTVDATETVDVGTLSTDSGDADGFLDGVSLATAGLVKGTLASAGQTLGALLRVDESGGGVLVKEPDIASGGKAVTYTCSAGSDTAVFDIYVVYLEV